MALIVALLAILAVGSSRAAFNQFPHFNQIPYGPGIGFKQPFHPFQKQIPYGYTQEKPLQLTCLEVFQDYEGYIDKGISANIKAASHNNFGHGGFLHGFDFHGALAKPGGSDLKAEFKFFSTKGGKISLIITKKGFVGDKCETKNFGNGLKAKRGISGGYGNPYSGGFNQFNGQNQFQPEGVVATFELKDHTAKHMSLDNLKPYSSIKELAGHGLIACNHVDVDYDGTAICVGDVLACCTLAYDHKDRKLELEYN